MIRPINTKVLIKPDAQQTETESGLIVHREDAEQINTGTVVSVGESVHAVCVSDKVMYESFAGSSVQHEGVMYLVMDVADIVAVIN